MAGRSSSFMKLSEFRKRMQLSEKLGLDERDEMIVSLLQKNPSMSQEEMARKIRLSQPSVGARIRKLKQKGVLSSVNGVNFRVAELYLAKIDVNSTDTTAVIKEFKDCPFFVNALVMSGRHNLCLFFMATDLKRMEGIVNHHLRGNPKVREIEMNIVISTAKDLVLPLNIDYENKEQVSCGQECRECI